ncbi:MAG: hypothetical protein Q7S52_02415 [bacterium]|nr:hypothetical protein [bacterium]
MDIFTGVSQNVPRIAGGRMATVISARGGAPLFQKNIPGAARGTPRPLGRG